jgi:hypothetical protein
MSISYAYYYAHRKTPCSIQPAKGATATSAMLAVRSWMSPKLAAAGFGNTGGVQMAVDNAARGFEEDGVGEGKAPGCM